jgi:tRNA-2-methylthio-N6-dimethylallyladenosine synthase
MNRRHTRGDYLHLVEKVRTARPDIALAGDFIVGFPGESDEDFEATLSIVAEVGYAAAFSFRYSSRPGTPAATRNDQVAETVKAARLARLQAAIDAGQQAFNRSRLGRVADVLFERNGRRPRQIVGRSPWLSPVQVDADAELVGTIMPVRIDAVGRNSLFGSLVGQSRQMPAAEATA